ncbi:sigma-54 interaction domain-containing protein [Bacillus sp. FJAT-45037]|uniref:sigma-54 interaction domain-containing protein n=1 Tax=Bacillus sp. FJAT-45037 TaxID=2011007 RepID=UPI000C249D1C|nr:sigma 54-interacting transcriptional regulator [Bacillus sp. FJAT-45037]
MFWHRANRKELFESIIDSIDEAIHVVDSKGMTIYYNKMAAKNDCVEINDVLGKHVLDVFPSLNKESSTLLKVIENGRPIYQQHQSFTNIRGQFIDTVNTTVPIFVEKTLVGAVEVAKDLSTVKQLSQKLIDLQASVKSDAGPSVKSRCATYSWEDIVTVDSSMLEAIKRAKKAARTSSPIMVYGETGTGKELFVQAIHQESPRFKNTLQTQNCASLPSTLLESLLFGTKKGSFTGAVDRPGLLELAHGGTLFLDELNSMPLDFQSKLLRVIEDGWIRRLGAKESRHIDVRYVVALNESPEDCVEKGKLRRDLFYRLNVCCVEIPPLRSRKEDIPHLFEHFRKKYNHQFQKLVTKIDDDVLNQLESYHWPGNVRELEHVVEYGVMMAEDDTVTVDHLSPYLLKSTERSMKSVQTSKKVSNHRSFKKIMVETERQLIKDALSETGGNVLQAAQLLDIPRQTLQYKIGKLNI